MLCHREVAPDPGSASPCSGRHQAGQGQPTVQPNAPPFLAFPAAPPPPFPPPTGNWGFLGQARKKAQLTAGLLSRACDRKWAALRGRGAPRLPSPPSTLICVSDAGQPR